ncbi:MAG: hypothetical protein H6562_21930 [Lewinellaceae bacterium]|nr:hypothetical protein [Lewinellaceae bacterium]
MNNDEFNKTVGGTETGPITYLPAEYLQAQIGGRPAGDFNDRFRDVLARMNARSNPLLVVLRFRKN